MSRREILQRVRLLSQARIAKHGPDMPDDPGLWWQQIEAIAADLAVPISWDEWCSVAKFQPREDA